MRHILIGGTGRAGTTLLVQVFTALGFDTGFTLDEAKSRIDPISQAGLEVNLRKGKRHHVMKAPALADHLAAMLADEGFEVEAAIVPMRDLFAAAESRRSVYDKAQNAGKDALAHPGSLWKTDNPAEQEAQLALQFYRFVQPLVANDVPLYLIDFPRFVGDGPYLYRALLPLMETHGVSEARLVEALAAVARPDAVHDFKTGSAGQAKAPTGKPGVIDRLFGKR